MTNTMKEKLLNKRNSGTKQERNICKQLLEEKNIKFKNLEDFSKKFNCSNSSVTRLTRSLGYPSFPHFYHEFSDVKDESLQHINNDLIWYSNTANDIAKNITGKIFIFSSRRGKSIAKFLGERLNTANIENEYYHESWGRTPEEEIDKISSKDTAILITMNGASNLANKYLDIMIKTDKVKKVVVLTANTKLKKDNKIIHYSLSKIDNTKYEVETFDGYNFACSRMVGLTVAIMKEIHTKKISKKN